MAKQNILLFNYAFPPHPGIGGRRWAKFTKYLDVKEEFNIHVLSAANTSGKISIWYNDVKNLKNISTYTYSSRFPQVILHYPTTILNKIMYRYHNFWMKRNAKGDPYDRSSLDKNIIQKKVREIIKTKSIDAVIVSIGPNMASYYITRLKSEFPAVKFIVDFRDPWTDFNLNIFYNEKSFSYESEIERITVNTADYIFTAYPQLTEVMRERHSETPEKFITITNGYDAADTSHQKAGLTERPLKLEISFVGSLHANIDHAFKPFIDGLAKIRNEKPELYKKLNINFYGEAGNRYVEYAAKAKIDIIKFNEWVSEDKAKLIIRESHLCLLFLMKNYEFTTSTKFYEYINLEKKILVASEPGYVPEIIRTNNLGFVINPQTSYQDLTAALNSCLETDFLLQPSTFDKTVFDVKNISHQLASHLNKIINE